MHPRSESVGAWAWNYCHILNHSPMFSALPGTDISIISVDRIVLGHTQLFARVLARIHFITHTQTRAHPQPSRFCAALGDWIAAIGMKIVFFRAPRIIVPRQHDDYDRRRQEHIVEKSFSLDLLCFGIGLVAVLLYLLSNL